MAAERNRLTFLGNLRTKMILGIDLVLVIVLGTFLYVEVIFHERSFLEEEEKWALEISHTLMRSIEYPMLVQDMGQVEAILQRVNGLEDVRVANLCDLSGTIKYSGIPDSIGKFSKSEVIKKVLRTNALATGLEIYKGEKILSHATPIRNEKACSECHGSEKDILGVLWVGTAWEPVEKKMEAIRNRDIVYSVVCLALVAGLIAILLRYLVITPLGLLARATTVIAEKGDLSYRIPIRRDDEVGQLATSFNTMIEDLDKSRNELAEWIQALKKKTKELEDFTFIVSHDLKEPLRGITSFSQFVLEDYADKLDEKGRGYLLTITKSTYLMKRLIDDLLTLSKVTRIEFSFQINKASEVIEKAVKPLKVLIDEKDIELVIAQDLPTIYCDKIRMAQVFENLLSNAIKFMGKENPRIEIGYQDKVDYDQFYVKDNGMGIEKGYHEKIFEMFERLHPREDYDGTGAGLHICKKIMEMHRGKIWVESEIGVGSTFYFTLPKRRREKW